NRVRIGAPIIGIVVDKSVFFVRIIVDFSAHRLARPLVNRFDRQWNATFQLDVKLHRVTPDGGRGDLARGPGIGLVPLPRNQHKWYEWLAAQRKPSDSIAALRIALELDVIDRMTKGIDAE